jgi:hypothetical protein
MQLSILISGILAALLFILSGISFFTGWANFKTLALVFIASAIIMFVLMILRNIKEEWAIGGYKPREK